MPRGKPYPPENKAIRFPNQVWSIDITYIPIEKDPHAPDLPLYKYWRI